MPEIRWRLTSSFPKSLDTIYGTAETFARYMREATDGKFQIQTFAAGEIIPGLQALDAVSNGSIELAHTPTYFYVGKDMTLGLGTGIPFGLNARLQHSWWHFGGGEAIVNEAMKPFGVYSIPCGNSGTQMGGWFRKEINTVEDLKGLKFRIGGLGGQVLAKLGVVPQQISPGDVYPALERGTIDGAEFVGPYDDEKLGLGKVAPYLLLSRLVGGRRDAASLHQHGQVERVAAALQGDHALGLRGGQQLDAGEIRRGELRGARPAHRLGHQAARLPARNHRCRLQGSQRVLCRGQRQEPAVQEGLRLHGGLPQGKLHLVAGRRIFLRQLHHPRHSRLIGAQPARATPLTESQGGGGVFLRRFPLCRILFIKPH
jgi:hypothetical protein